MDTEYHYWITGWIAKEAGFTQAEAATIAYASEFVDENDVCFSIQDRSDGKKYGNFISQTMNILKPKNELMRIYPIFHFVPGEPTAPSARRRDGKMHLLNTTPNNPIANELLDEAFKATDDTRLYRIGIATHAYVDTWAHQNFVGWYDYFNNIGLDIKPDIGHADGEHHPDWVGHRWNDNRLVDSDISNLNRFLSASKALFGKYCDHIKTTKNKDNSGRWTQLEQDLKQVMGPSYTGNQPRYEQDRLQAYKQKTGKWLQAFNQRLWFDAAIETEINGARDSHDGLGARFTLFEDEYFWKEGQDREKTDWYRFQESVKAHEKLALKLLKPKFKTMGVNIAKA